jgi:DNA replication and repair protein RecF
MIKQLTVKNFRIFDEKTVDFNPGVNVILGKNGVGKTSLLEAIYFTSFTKSFKASQDVDMVKQEKDFFQISSTWEESKYKKAQANYLKKKGKRFIFDEEIMVRMADVIGSFPVVFQSPEDFRVTAGPSIERRGYFDRFISQTSRSYLQDLINYRKLLKNRNATLKQLSEKKEYTYTTQLEVYDEQLSPIMFRIVSTRRSHSEVFNKHLKELYETTFNNGSTGNIAYKPSLTAETEADFQIAHREKTQNNIDKEIILRRTLWGPNYDKYLFLRNNTPLIHYASQGEHKIWMTMLKLAEGKIITELKKTEPIYLLDDLFAELDLNNSKRIIEKIIHAKQVIISTTDMSDLSRHGMDINKNNINIIEIS